MDEQSTFEALVNRGVQTLGTGPRSRAQAARELVPSALRVLAGSSKAVRDGYGCKLAELWEDFERERAGAKQGAWPELQAAFFAVAELVRSPLVAVAHETTPADLERVAACLAPAENYVLLAGAEGGAYRVFVDQVAGGPTDFAVDGPEFVGRSHELALRIAMLRRTSAPWGPIAATGQVLANDRVGRVEALPEKIAAFCARFSMGHVLTPPPDRDGGCALPSILRALGHDRLDREQDSRLRSWICVASIEEAKWKLGAVHAENIVESWDGHGLTGDQVVELGFTGPESLEQACLRTEARGEDPIAGVLVEGGPGTGKSILCQQIEGWFLTGPLGSLGGAVKVRARELARHFVRQDLDVRTADLVSCLPKLDSAPLEVVHALVRSGRLWLVVDGLDEVGAAARRDIMNLLSRPDVRFVVTTRPLGLTSWWPPHRVLRIAACGKDQARDILTGLGREDLGRQIAADSGGLPAAVTELASTPFHLSLLAAVIPEGEALGRCSIADLYRRAFERMLERACTDDRLDDPEHLRRVLPGALGALASRWLDSPSEPLDQVAVELALKRKGVAEAEHGRVMRALERGHLLAGGNEGWEFGHRTVAEWLAAGHLRRGIEQRVDGTTEDRSEIEAEMVGPYLAPVDSGRPRLWQMLLFYMPRSSHPEALICQLVTSWAFRASQAHVVDMCFEAAAEIAASACWRGDRAGVAQVLGVLARWQIFEGANRLYPRREHIWLDRFLCSADAVLPASVGEVRAVVARTPEQVQAVEAEPERLVQVLSPTALGSLFEEWGGLGWPAQCALLERCAVLDVPPPWEIVRAICENAEEDPDERPGLLVKSDAVGREELAFEAVRKLGTSLPRALLWRRLVAWPQHLRPSLSAIVAEVLSDEDVVDLLALCLTEIVDARAGAEAHLRALPEHSVAPAVDKVEDSLRFQDVGYISIPLRRLAEECGLIESGIGRSGREAGSEGATLRAAAVQLWRAHDRLGCLLEVLRAAMREEDRLADLWPRLPPGAAERRQLVAVLSQADRSLPALLPVAEIAVAVMDCRWGGAVLQIRTEQLQASHIIQLREIAECGQGALRFAAARWLAEHTDVEQAWIGGLLDDGDADVLREVGHFLASHEADLGGLTDCRGLQTALRWAPLKVRARMGTPGWQEELHTELREATAEQLRGLCDIVLNERLRSAVPILLAVLARKEHYAVAQVLAELATPDDTAVVRRLVSLPARLAPAHAVELVDLSTLDALLAREDLPSPLRLECRDILRGWDPQPCGWYVRGGGSSARDWRPSRSRSGRSTVRRGPGRRARLAKCAS